MGISRQSLIVWTGSWRRRSTGREPTRRRSHPEEWDDRPNFLKSDGHGEAQESLNVVELVIRSFETRQRTITRFKVAAYNPDFVVKIPSNACATFELHRADEMIALGYKRAGAELGRV
ncbi:MAG: hypothetical protein GXP47_00635 [Acidobacteria bacterium]|nr:hypothetical protein [Acidobacteriota bacterium]